MCSYNQQSYDMLHEGDLADPMVSERLMHHTGRTYLRSFGGKGKEWVKGRQRREKE